MSTLLRTRGWAWALSHDFKVLRLPDGSRRLVLMRTDKAYKTTVGLTNSIRQRLQLENPTDGTQALGLDHLGIHLPTHSWNVDIFGRTIPVELGPLKLISPIQLRLEQYRTMHDSTVKALSLRLSGPGPMFSRMRIPGEIRTEVTQSVRLVINPFTGLNIGLDLNPRPPLDGSRPIPEPYVFWGLPMPNLVFDRPVTAAEFAAAQGGDLATVAQYAKLLSAGVTSWMTGKEPPAVLGDTPITVKPSIAWFELSIGATSRYFPVDLSSNLKFFFTQLIPEASLMVETSLPKFDIHQHSPAHLGGPFHKTVELINRAIGRTPPDPGAHPGVTVRSDPRLTAAITALDRTPALAAAGPVRTVFEANHLGIETRVDELSTAPDTRANQRRIATLQRLLTPRVELVRDPITGAMQTSVTPRQYLVFDDHAGQVAEVFGDLSAATGVQVRVLPRGTSLEGYAGKVATEVMQAVTPGTVVVAVTGYDGPLEAGVLQRQPANTPAARLLDELEAAVHAQAPTATVTFVSHRSGRPLHRPGGP
jgi:hypothetical protein